MSIQSTGLGKRFGRIPEATERSGLSRSKSLQASRHPQRPLQETRLGNDRRFPDPRRNTRGGTRRPADRTQYGRLAAIRRRSPPLPTQFSSLAATARRQKS